MEVLGDNYWAKRVLKHVVYIEIKGLNILDQLIFLLKVDFPNTSSV